MFSRRRDGDGQNLFAESKCNTKKKTEDGGQNTEDIQCLALPLVAGFLGLNRRIVPVQKLRNGSDPCFALGYAGQARNKN